MVGLISNFFRVVLLTVLITQIQAQENKKYKIHDENRPRPDSVTPSTFSQMATPPSDAIILFDGKEVNGESTLGRQIAQVFQFAVVYDTMNVFDNLAFPLRNSGEPEDKIKRRVC